MRPMPIRAIGRMQSMSRQRRHSPRKLAIITTVWKYLSHAQHMGDRFLVGYPYEGKWHHPAFEVAALYVDQKPAADESAERARSSASRYTRPSPRPCAVAATSSPSTGS